MGARFGGVEPRWGRGTVRSRGDGSGIGWTASHAGEAMDGVEGDPTVLPPRSGDKRCPHFCGPQSGGVAAP